MSTAISDAPRVPSVLIQVRPVAPRLVSIDVFRGILVAGMVLVTTPGTYSYVFAPLKHADWNGATLTDMIFPSFLFLVGVSKVYSFAARERREEGTWNIVRHVLLRSLGLIVFGFLLNHFDVLHVHDWRIPGVLQRIGLFYCGAGLVTWRNERVAEWLDACGFLRSLLAWWLFIGRCRPMYLYQVTGWAH